MRLLQIGLKDGEETELLLRVCCQCSDDTLAVVHTSPSIPNAAKLFSFGQERLVLVHSDDPEEVLREPTGRIQAEVLRGPACLHVAYYAGDRAPKTVTAVSEILWHYLRSGGLMIWDGYCVSRKRREPNLRDAVDAFLATVQAEALEKNYQAIARKR